MIRFFADHPTAANLLMVGFLMVGLAFAPSVKRETFPDIPARSVEVRIPFPGATAVDVEEAVCQRVEEAADGIDNREETRCDAREGMAIATLVMREGRDLAQFLDDVKSKVDAVTDLPEGAEDPVVRQLGRSDFVAFIAVAGPLRPEGLKAYAERMKDDLLAIPGVAQVTVRGFSQHQIRIEAPASTMRQFGLSLRDLADAVAAQSLKLPVGAIETRESTVLLRFDDERRRPRDFDDLVVVGSGSGAAIRLGDIAAITDRFEREESRAYFNGQRAAFLAVEKGKGDDILDVIDALRAYVDEERARAPPGMAFEIARDVASIVRDRLTMLLRNGVQGLGLVFLVMWLFFGLRYSFWVAAGLPVAFMGTIAGMAAIGYSFDMITMVGLLIAVGLLMDDAIVIAENVARHRQAGRPPLEAAATGTKEVMPGVLASFFTTVAVFGALAFLRGDIGAVLGVLPVILILTLSFSLVEAFLILPHHLMGTLRSREGPGRGGFGARFDAGLARFTEGFVGRLVDRAVDRRYLTLGLIAALLLVSLSLVVGGKLKFRAFPDIEGNVVEARLLLPQGTPLARTEAVVERVVRAVREVGVALAPLQPEGRSLVRNVGVQYNRNVDAYESGSHIATVTVDLLPSGVRNASLDEVIDRWRKAVGEVPDVLVLKFAEPQLGPGGRPIDIRLTGGDLGELKAASTELIGWLGGYRGVLDLSDDLRPGKPEARLRLREGALSLGLSAAAVAGQLRAAFHGQNAAEVQLGPEDYEINVRLSEADRDSLADLIRFTITLPTGEQAPLDAVATVESTRGYARVHRVEGRRAVTIRGDLDTDVANAGEILADTRARFLPGLEARYPGDRGRARRPGRGDGGHRGVVAAELPHRPRGRLPAALLPVPELRRAGPGHGGDPGGPRRGGLGPLRPRPRPLHAEHGRLRLARGGGGEQLHRAGGVHQAPPAQRGVGDGRGAAGGPAALPGDPAHLPHHRGRDPAPADGDEPPGPDHEAARREPRVRARRRHLPGAVPGPRPLRDPGRLRADGEGGPAAPEGGGAGGTKEEAPGGGASAGETPPPGNGEAGEGEAPEPERPPATVPA